MPEGLVIKSTGSWVTVRTEDGMDINCRIKGTYRIKDIKATNPVTVGDHVEFLMNDDGTGLINEIAPRKNYIIRRAPNLSKQYQLLAANIDIAWVIVSLVQPKTFTEFIDRFLVSAEAYRITAHIIFNKTDLYGSGEMEEVNSLVELYESIGYRCFRISATTGKNLDKVIEIVTGKVNLFAGNSGVGKSTLINAIDPSMSARVGELSGYHKSGKHTTTFAQMYELRNNTHIIDSPGIKGFGIVDMDRDEIFHFFPEIFKVSSRCQFYNCMHVHEPGCAVKEAVNEGNISLSRYSSYLSILSGDEKYR